MWMLFILINSIYQYSDNIYYKNRQILPLYNEIINNKGNIQEKTKKLLFELTYLDPAKLLPEMINKLKLPDYYKQQILYLNGYNCPKWSFLELAESEGMKEIR